MGNSDCQYEVLNPWAEVDSIPLRGISPRVADLADKTIGLYACTRKAAAHPIQTVVEAKLKERFPSLKFSWFRHGVNIGITETEDKARFEEWVRGVDTVVTAIGD